MLTKEQNTSSEQISIENNINQLLSSNRTLLELLSKNGFDKQIAKQIAGGLREIIPLKRLVTDPKLNIRRFSAGEAAKPWTALMKEGAAFPPIQVFPCGEKFTIIDGVLRYENALRAGLTEIEAIVHQCSQGTAFMMRIQMNSTHGIILKTSEKKPFVVALLKHPEASALKARPLARIFGIDHKTIIGWRKKLGEIPQPGADDQSVHQTDRNPSLESENAPLRNSSPDNTGGGRALSSEESSITHSGSAEINAAGNTSAGFDSAEASQIFTVVGKTEVFCSEEVPIMARAAQQRWQVARGERFRVKSASSPWWHYVICGDSTLPETWTGLAFCTPGAMMITDPTYSGEIPAEGRDYNPAQAKPICVANNLSKKQIAQMLSAIYSNVRKCLRDGAYFYAFESFHYRAIFENAAKMHLGVVHQPFRWIKRDYIKPMYAVYGYGDESGIFGWVRRPGSRLVKLLPGLTTCNFGEEFEDSAYDVGSKYHACSKPVLLLQRFIERHSLEENVVIDPFLGSGSTAVAAEISRRICVGVEIVPEYVALGLERLAERGCTIQKMSADETFIFPDKPILAETYGTDQASENEVFLINDYLNSADFEE